MTIWTPDIARFRGPKYIALADAIGAAIREGELAAGSRLPTHRDLARALGVTVGTVSRGYAEAHRRGLVTGEVGRGTFVRRLAAEEAAGFNMPEPTTPDLIDLSFNSPPLNGADDPVVQELGRITPDEMAVLLGYQPRAGLPLHRHAAALWVNRCGIPTSEDEVVITTGGQHALMLAVSAATEPGDLVLAENLTYPGMKALARWLRLRLEGLPLDDDGVVPEAFEDACRRSTPRAIYLTPTLQNPTGSVMPKARRRAIADIAVAHGVTIVEDDIHGFLLDDGPAPVSSFAPDASFYLTSFSKSVAPGLRVGYLRTPQAHLEALRGAIMTTTVMAPPVMAEVATRLVESGRAEEIVVQRRRDAETRNALAREVLGEHAGTLAASPGFHLWLRLPEPWRAEEFTAQARCRGVAVASSETFAVGRGAAPHAVRVSIGATLDLDVLERGLRTLVELLRAGPPCSDAGV